MRPRNSGIGPRFGPTHAATWRTWAGRTAGPVSASRPETPGAARGFGQGGDLAEGRVGDPRDHQLRDAGAARHGVGLLTVVDQDHADLAAIVGVDRAGAVE